MFARGAFPSSRHELAGATPHAIFGTTPPRILFKPALLSFWGNEADGDCCTAEEAFAKACYGPEIFITEQEAVDWATQNGVLNGATLSGVLDLMRKSGFWQNGKLYNDGPKRSVDWTNPEILQNAIAQHRCVKIGVAADQIQAVVPNPPVNGWFADGFKQDPNLDHCVGLCGFGEAEWLANELGGTLPDGFDHASLAYAMFTWKSIGIITPASMLAITGEAWLRHPITLIQSLSDSTVAE